MKKRGKQRKYGGKMVKKREKKRKKEGKNMKKTRLLRYVKERRDEKQGT